MTYIDLDDKVVPEDLYDKANAMTEIFHEHCQKWARRDDFPEGVWDYSGLGAKGSEYHHELGYYWGFRAREYDRGEHIHHIVSVYVAVSDELGGFDLVGFYDEGKLVYLTSCVDTSWSEVWVGEYPTGLIDMSKPYEREGRFLNAPPEAEAEQP